MLNTYSARKQVYDITVKVNESRTTYWIHCALNIRAFGWNEHKAAVGDLVSGEQDWEQNQHKDDQKYHQIQQYQKP